MVDRSRLATEIESASHALHARGWVANHDGNVSVRLGPDRLMVTPTATSKADVCAGGLAVTDAAGVVVEGDARPPGEFSLHAFGCYAVREDIGAVVHAHPPYATALACAGRSLTVFIAEAVVSLGAEIPLAALAAPSGREGAAPIAALLDRHDAVLLAGHGVVTVGGCVEQAMLRMELVEHLARIYVLALPLGGVAALPEAMVADMLGKRRAAAGSLGLAAAKAGIDSGSSAGSSGSSAGSSGSSAGSSGSSAGSSGSSSAGSRASTHAGSGAEPAPALDPTAWTPAGPAPAPDAWSGGRTEGACGAVYGAAHGGDLVSAVQAEIARTLAGKH